MAEIELLLHVQRLPPQGAGLRAALALAGRLEARLDAIYIVDMPPAAFTLPEAVPMQLDAARQRTIDARELEKPWEELIREHALEGAWRVAQGDSLQILCHATAGYDLLVMERGSMRSDAPVGFGIVSRSVFGSSRPVLVVPEQSEVASLGERILISWNGSREAALAIRAALPLLRRAGSIVVLDGTDESYPDTCALPIDDVCAWLRRHDINADYRRLEPSETKSPGIVLLNAAQEYGSDMVVMGAWGRSRISEMVLGGTTRHMFMHSNLPMLVAH